MKIFFLNIDGALTEPGTNVPPRGAVDAIRAARSAGNEAFLRTGRNHAMLPPLPPYGFDGCIASAGGYVVRGDKALRGRPITDGQRDAAARPMRENGVLIGAEAEDGAAKAFVQLKLS